MKKIAVYPGTFDPPTNRHIDLIARGRTFSDLLVVGVGINASKMSLFSLEERVSMLNELTKDMANVKVQAFGKTKQELFSNALKGMTEILKPVSDSQSANRNIKVESIDLDSLLVDFLSEVLYLSQINREVYNNVKFDIFNDKKLEGELIGDKIRSLGEEIKAVTYHGLKIDQPRLASGEAGQKNGLYQATILFDI